MQLDNWIERRHLDRTAQAGYARAFAAAPQAALVIDDFLRADKLAALQRMFAAEGEFAERYTIWESAAGPRHGRETPVTEAEWRAAPEESRASVERILVGAKPGAPLAPGIAVHLKFAELLGSAAFMEFLAAVTGIRAPALTGMQTRIMVGGQSVGPHSDAGRGRALCAIYYVSPGWRPEFGGRFRHRGPGPAAVPVPPLANRFLVFAPRKELKHDVEAMAAAGGRWQRWSYSLWFGDAPEADDP